MRKGFDALSGMVRSQMLRNPLTGEVFIFMDQTRTTIKILSWESVGLVIYHKRLEQGRFEESVYHTQDKSCHLKCAELVMMVPEISMQNRVQRKDTIKS